MPLDINTLGILVALRRNPHPVIVTIRGTKDYIRVLFYIPIIPLLQGGGSS